MQLVATGIVTNEYNEILLIQRPDSKTWAPPGGKVELGELPTEAAAREVLEETGVKVVPVRLVGAQFWADPIDPHLHLIFRCLQSGGQAGPTQEALKAGYFKARSLPRPMRSFHRQRIEMARFHTGPAAWLTINPSGSQKIVNRIRRWGRTRKEMWTADCLMIIENRQGEVFVDHSGRLPFGPSRPGEAPWTAARRLTWPSGQSGEAPEKLAAFLIHRDRPHMTVVFFCRDLINPPPGQWVPLENALLPPGAPPANLILDDPHITHIGFWGADNA